VPTSTRTPPPTVMKSLRSSCLQRKPPRHHLQCIRYHPMHVGTDVTKETDISTQSEGTRKHISLRPLDNDLSLFFPYLSTQTITKQTTQTLLDESTSHTDHPHTSYIAHNLVLNIPAHTTLTDTISTRYAQLIFPASAHILAWSRKF